MIIVKLVGGIGNQMFQYSFARVFRTLGKKAWFDTTWYNTRASRDILYPRPLRLDKFQINGFQINNTPNSNTIISESKVGYNPDIFKKHNNGANYNFHGYWQYYTYYKEIIPILQNEFLLKPEVYTDNYFKVRELIEGTESVSIHVRRGDYQLHRVGSFRDLQARYYFDALKLVKGTHLFVFSDDIIWCKETFKQEYFDMQLVFVDLEDYICFELMRMCKHNINTNSTFSWWAAILNRNPNKKVICPITYQGDSIENSDKLRYPQEWIKIEDYAN